MKHHNLVKNPIFKIVGIGLILYYALFSNKHDNRSLSRRYSPENIKESFSNAAKQKREINKKIYEAKRQQTILKTEDKNEKE